MKLRSAWLGVFLVSLLAVSALPAQERLLNVKDADVRTLAEQVSQITGLNFIIDPRVKGTVTVVSSHPMSTDEIYEVFLSVLKVHGFAALKNGNVVKIVPEAQSKQDINVITDDGARPGKRDEIVTRVLQVRNVSASQLIPILRPLIPQYGHLAAYQPTNVIIISDTAGNIDRLMGIIANIDTASDASIEIVSLKYASASDMVKVLTGLEESQHTNEQPTQKPKLVADERTNTLLLGGEKTGRARLKQLIRRLDVPTQATGNTQVFYLRFAKASDLAKVLSQVGAKIAQTAAPDKNAASATTATSASNKPEIQADDNTNALIVTASADVMRNLQNVIRQLDIRRAQVLVEAVIVEVSIDKANQLGLEWAFGNGTNSIIGSAFNVPGSATGATLGQVVDIVNNLKNDVAVANPVNTILGTGGSAGIAKTGRNGLPKVSALLRALFNDSAANLLSTPSLVTLDNAEAEIVVGQNVPFITGEFSNTGQGSTPDNPFRTIQREDVGLKLRVTPHINEGDTLSLEIEQEVSAISASAVAGASDLVTDKRSIKTHVQVDDGETIVLGGLIDDKLREVFQKVPFLGDIPILGYLFQSKRVTRQKVNLMVFLRPKILRAAHSDATHSQGQYNLLRDMQLQDENIPLFPDDSRPILPEWGETLSEPAGDEKVAQKADEKPAR